MSRIQSVRVYGGGESGLMENQFRKLASSLIKTKTRDMQQVNDRRSKTKWNEKKWHYARSSLKGEPSRLLVYPLVDVSAISVFSEFGKQ